MNRSTMVRDVPLIPQDKTLSCWYACGQMLIRWRRETRRMTEGGMPAPDEEPTAAARYAGNNVIPFAAVRQYAESLGLRVVPAAAVNWSPDYLSGLLEHYGPLWAWVYKPSPTGAYHHIVVIVGVGPDAMWIHDPEPVGVGTKGWQPYTWLNLPDADRAQITGQFLYCP